MTIIRSPVVVWGAGAMGGTIGAHLVRAGVAVLFVDSDPAHVAAMRKSGLRITGPQAAFEVLARAVLPPEVPGQLSAPMHTVLLCVKAHHTGAALAELAPHLAPDGCVVSIQNGLAELEIRDVVGESRTVGAFVNFGADVLEPGLVHWGGRGAVVVGELDGRLTPRVEGLVDLLRHFEREARATGNILGYLWGKLAYAALLFDTALTDASIADVLAEPRYRALHTALAREVMRVAEAEGIDAEGFDGFDPMAFQPEAGDEAAHRSLDDLVAFNRRSAKTHSGIWRDLAVRKRPTEVDAQLGAVTSAGARRGVPTPLTRRLVELIHEIEAGRLPQGWSTLDLLRDAHGGGRP